MVWVNAMSQEGSLDSYSEFGYGIVSNVLDANQVKSLRAATEFQDAGSTHQRGGQAYANRAALTIEAVAALAKSDEVLGLVSKALSQKPFAVRAILFDKVEGANWKIPWHQDITIAVRDRHETEGYGPWSVKEGTPHVQAPTRILQNMVAIRLHLDDCSKDNGPLRVVPKSHLPGRIKKSEIWRLEPDANSKELVCRAGDAILMSPLTLHASSPASSPNHRRVIHIEYACCELDAPLQWARQI